MTLQIKERIVGVIVIVCLILIWGPFFLNKKSPEQTTQKNNPGTANQASNQIQLPVAENTKPQGTQLVDNTLPPQTTEEQLQPKQPPVLPMPASQSHQVQSQQVIEDEDIAPEPTLEWSGKGEKPKATAPKATATKNNPISKEIPDEDQDVTLPPQPINANHDQDSRNDVNDEKMLKTSEANEAKLKKLFEKNEQAAISAKVVAAATKVKSPTVEAKPVQKINKNKETKSVVNNTNNKWIVEVATLSNPHYVAVLKQKLAKNGFTAFSREGRSSNGNAIFHVWIGAENNREQAESLAKRLEQTSRMSGKVVKGSSVG